MVIHDTSDGIADQSGATGSEDYGNLVYNVGWYSSCDRSHGHTLYIQSSTSSERKVISDTIGYNSFDINMQAYGEHANVSNLHFIGNVHFNGGLPGAGLHGKPAQWKGRAGNVVVEGGAVPKRDLLFDSNVFYDPLLPAPAPNNTGYNELSGGHGGKVGINITLTNNWFVCAANATHATISLVEWEQTTVHGNSFVGQITTSSIGSHDWSNNTYYRSTPPSVRCGIIFAERG